MTALLLIWFGWSALALLLGLFIGLSIRIADKAESPEQPADADTARLDVLL